MHQETTLVLGASETPWRYSYMATKMLRSYGYPVIAVGKRPGQIADVTIETAIPPDARVDTVTLYLNPLHQEPLYGAILALKPRRIIFNPGAENDELADLAREAGIEPVEACTLVMLRTGQY